LGWSVAATLHLLWGAPMHRAEAPAVRAALAAAGLHPLSVVPVRADSSGSRPFMVTTATDGPGSGELFSSAGEIAAYSTGARVRTVPTAKRGMLTGT